MSGDRRDRRAPTIAPSNQPRGTCRRCVLPILREDGTPNLRRNWHPACVDAHRWETDSSYVARQVFKRDRGVCAACGLDVQAFVAGVEAELDGGGRWDRGLRLARELERRGWGRVPEWRTTFWEADHVVPLHAGGAHEMANLQTLCIPCHKAKSAAEAGARAARA